jgi:hypothetical protein
MIKMTQLIEQLNRSYRLINKFFLVKRIKFLENPIRIRLKQ